ncbi:MAG: hypothetical protein ACI8TA_002103 [Cyclobacteriaceae bacterium]|jgi:hypothetical protein
MLRLNILALFICFFVLTIIEGNCQSTKKITIKAKYPGIKEAYYVLKDDISVKHGQYEKTKSGKLVYKGNYNNGQKTGQWEYFNTNEELMQVVDFDTYDLITNNDSKSSLNSCVILGGIQQFYSFIYSILRYPRCKN